MLWLAVSELLSVLRIRGWGIAFFSCVPPSLVLCGYSSNSFLHSASLHPFFSMPFQPSSRTSWGVKGSGRKGGSTIFYPVFQHQFCALARGFPPRRYAASRRFAAEISEETVSFVEDGVLLLETHCCGVLMGVSVQAAFGMVNCYV